MAMETLKIINEMTPPNLVRLRDNSMYNFRYNNILQVPQVKTTKYGKTASGMLQQSYGTAPRRIQTGK